MFCKFLSQDIVNFSYEKLLFYSLLKVVQILKVLMQSRVDNVFRTEFSNLY